ncbi:MULTISPECIES: CCE_0567 family metalloprotein [Sinorhizobium]|uniref:CCE_0567 family metalloprotein n=1 Tax=Sinorhizobium TaxID=28105 RepID=UPI0004280940|nr:MULTISPECIES: CCE_0567 family metalloprotein [Sinorhizobium]WOS66932.1 CCE_0567 family metalloprotein [Sinorhizobium fredii GR64]
MSDLEELQQKVRKLQSSAGAARWNCTTLPGTSPVNWTEIKAGAEKTFAVFAELDAAKRDLAALENSR